MRFNALTTIITLLPLTTTAQSFFDFAIYTDSFCSTFIGGIDGTTASNCTPLLPIPSPPTTTTSTTSACYTHPHQGAHTSSATPSPTPSAESLWMQSNGFIGNCQVTLYSDESCVNAVGGFGNPPNLGCVGVGAEAKYYQVSGC